MFRGYEVFRVMEWAKEQVNRGSFCVWVTTDECQPSSFANLLIISVGIC